MLISNIGLVRIATVSPILHLGNPIKNAEIMCEIIKQCDQESVEVICFPELSLTGYTCDDLFHQEYMNSNVKKALNFILNETKKYNQIVAFGAPIKDVAGRLLNTALVIQNGKILGVQAKKYLPNYGEFYDMRFFTSGKNLITSFFLDNQEYPIQDVLIHVVDDSKKYSIGLSICEDDWAPHQNAVDISLSGANIILNLSASNELVSKSVYRKELIKQLSARTHTIYAYASAGPHESTKDTVFGGHCFIYENGNLLSESKRFVLDHNVIEISDADYEKVDSERTKNTTFSNSNLNNDKPIHPYITKRPANIANISDIRRKIQKNPFLDQKDTLSDEKAEEIFQILSTGIAQQLMKTGLKKLVMGLSGGMDSTLVSLICIEALKKINRPSTDLITLSMPGFGTSNRTKTQSSNLAKILGTTFFEIDICKAVQQHFLDIQQPDGVYDITYENAQARERTQIILDMANKHNGLMIGSGSLSEIACGFSTYGGDSISHVNPIGSCPKSLSRHLIKYYGKKDKELTKILTQIIETKISPELLPNPDRKEIIQSSEDFLGDYNIIDFILYHQIRNAYSKDKIYELLKIAYNDDNNPKYTNEYFQKVLDTYYKRFYQNQFKRTMMPQSFKIGISLSPRADWRMPDLTGYF